MTKWNEVLQSGWDREAVKLFVQGKLSGRQLYNEFVYTPAGGVVRNLLRKHGVRKARRLACKALSRRTSWVGSAI